MGRSELLRQTLHSIARQASYSGTIEVIVVTKEPVLDMEKLPDSLSGIEIPVRVLNVGLDLSIAAQRNLGASQSASKHIAFVDADILLAPDWLATMQHLLDENVRRVIVSAVQRCSTSPTTLEVIRTDQANVHTDVDLQHMPGRNLFMRRIHFETVGGFPERLATCEDYYFTGMAAGLGALHYSSRSSYVHLGEDKFLVPMFVKEIWRGASNLQSITGRAVEIDELPSFIVPVWVMLAALGSLVSLLIASPQALMLSLIFFLAPVSLFSFRLKYRTRSTVRILDLIYYYSLYFIARGIGMCLGVVRALVTTGTRLRRSST